MSNKKVPLISAAKEALFEFKNEIANEMGVDITDTVDPKIAAFNEVKEAALNNMRYGPFIGGNMVKNMIANAESEMKKL